MRYVLSKSAAKQMRDIRRYTLENWGAEQSSGYIAGLVGVFELLSKNQNLGQICDSDFGYEIFRFHLKRHTVYYRKLEEKILIIGVLHQSMVPLVHITRGI